MEEEKKLTAKGIDIHGNKKEFDCTNGYLHCYNNQLISLTIPKGVTYVYCRDNQLTELTIPEGVERVYCGNNQLTSLTFPDSVEYVIADKEVTGLEKYIGTDIKIFLN